MQCLIGILILLVGLMCGFIIGEASCMTTYTEWLEKSQRAFEKKIMKIMEDMR